MTTQVNSPFLLPKVRPRTGTVEDLQRYLTELERILQQLYRRTGAETDSTAGVDNSLVAFHKLNFNRIPEYRSISSTHTTSGSDEVLICTADLTINLSNESQDRARVRVKVDGDYTVTIEGNAQNINGESQQILYLDGTLVDFVYYAELGEWIIE